MTHAACNKGGWENAQVQRLRRSLAEDEIDLRWLLCGEVAGPGALEDLVDGDRALPHPPLSSARRT